MQEGIEHVTVNYSGGKVREAILHNRRHLVAPLTMLSPGVLPGSDGAILYPEDEVAKNPSAWNNMPIVANHPVVNGSPVSARDPEILNQYAVGAVLNSKIRRKKLVAEGWFDIAETERIEPRILSALESNTPIELSTGLFVRSREKAPQGAVLNGKSYTVIGRDYSPDHLAVLIDDIGACSINDGCGVLVNALGEETDALTQNQMSHDDLREKLRDLLIVKNLQPDSLWIVDVFDKEVVYQVDGELFSVGYSTDLRSDDVSLSSEPPVEVRRVVKYKPITNEMESQGMSKLTANERSELVTKLTTNCDCWSVEDVTTLNTFSDEKLNKLVSASDRLKLTANSAVSMTDDQKRAVEDAAKQGAEELVTPVIVPELTTTNTSKPGSVPVAVTSKEWLEAAPPEIQSVVRNAMAMETKEKESLVDRITANLSGEQKTRVSAHLNSLDLGKLRDMSALAPEGPATPPVRPGYYGGAGSPVGNQGRPVVNADDDLLLMPTINYNDEFVA